MCCSSSLTAVLAVACHCCSKTNSAGRWKRAPSPTRPLPSSFVCCEHRYATKDEHRAAGAVCGLFNVTWLSLTLAFHACVLPPLLSCTACLCLRPRRRSWLIVQLKVSHRATTVLRANTAFDLVRVGSLFALVIVCADMFSSQRQGADPSRTGACSGEWHRGHALERLWWRCAHCCVCVTFSCTLPLRQTCIARVEAEFAAARVAEREGHPMESSVEASSAAMQAEAAAFSPATSNICFVYACTKIKSDGDTSQASSSSS